MSATTKQSLATLLNDISNDARSIKASRAASVANSAATQIDAESRALADKQRRDAMIGDLVAKVSPALNSIKETLDVDEVPVDLKIGEHTVDRNGSTSACVASITFRHPRADGFDPQYRRELQVLIALSNKAVVVSRYASAGQQHPKARGFKYEDFDESTATEAIVDAVRDIYN